VARLEVDMIVRETRFYRLAEVFFDEEPGSVEADIVEYFQRPTPLSGVDCREFYTPHLDLTRSLEDLRADLSRSFRLAINRAQREGCLIETWNRPDEGVVDDFLAFFDRFAAGKGLAPASAERLHALRRSAQLDLSAVSRDRERLVWHAYLRACNRSRLLHSASLFREATTADVRNQIGRANRLLHWDDLVRFKEAGVQILDLGGWYQGHDDEELLRVNRFKEGMGGYVVREFHCVRAASPRGHALLLLRRLRRR
jgi:hypothetical protein